MRVFNVYFKILKTQKTAILIYAAIFLALTILMSTTYINDEMDQFSVQKVNALVVNEDGQNEFLDGFLNYLENYVTYVEVEDNEETRKDALFYRKVEYILTIPKGFTEAFLSGEETTMSKEVIPDSMEAVAVDHAVDNYMNSAKVYLKHIPDIGQQELNQYVRRNLSNETKVSFDITRQDEKRSSDEFNNYYFNYLGYVLIAVFIIAVSSAMLSFQKIDIRRRHHASPITLRNLNTQLLFANLIFVFSYLVIFIVAGFISNPFRRVDVNLLLYCINAVVFAITTLSLSYLIGISVTSKKAVSAISTAISLSLAFISGMFVPQEFLGESVLRLASFTPTYWYIKVNNTIVSLTGYQWDNVSEILAMMAIQIGFAAAFISIVMVVSKRKSQQAY
jgi:ABC-2 type transport system permease protein